MAAFHQQHIYCIEEVLEQPIFLNPHNKLNFSSNNPCFYSIPSDKFTIIRDFCRFLEPGIVSYMRSEENLDHNHLKGFLFSTIGSTKLEKKLLKNPSSRFYVLIAKVLENKRLAKTFQ